MASKEKATQEKNEDIMRKLNLSGPVLQQISKSKIDREIEKEQLIKTKDQLNKTLFDLSEQITDITFKKDALIANGHAVDSNTVSNNTRDVHYY